LAVAAGNSTPSATTHATPAVDTSKAYTPLYDFAYTLNAVGNRTQVVDASGTTTYAYDNLHRLTSVTYPGPTTDTYTYDANGNRTAKNSTAYVYDNADQLTTLGGSTYGGYDNNGNLTSRASDAFAWDHENRMTSATVSSATTTYAYSGTGLRRSRTANSVTTTYTWDVVGGLPVILQDGTYTYVYGLGMIYWVDGSGNVTYRLTDGLGSTVALANSSGVVTDSYTYDVFGAVKTHSGSNATEFTFTGEQNDPNGLEYLRARYYDSATGRFLGRDPLPCGPKYTYGGNNPANMMDPTGLYMICADDSVFGYICFDSTEIGLGSCDPATGDCYTYHQDGSITWADACDANGICLFPDGTILGPNYYNANATDFVPDMTSPATPTEGPTRTPTPTPKPNPGRAGVCASKCIATTCLPSCLFSSPFASAVCDACQDDCITECILAEYP